MFFSLFPASHNNTWFKLPAKTNALLHLPSFRNKWAHLDNCPFLRIKGEMKEKSYLTTSWQWAFKVGTAAQIRLERVISLWDLRIMRVARLRTLNLPRAWDDYMYDYYTHNIKILRVLSVLTWTVDTASVSVLCDHLQQQQQRSGVRHPSSPLLPVNTCSCLRQLPSCLWSLCASFQQSPSLHYYLPASLWR